MKKIIALVMIVCLAGIVSAADDTDFSYIRTTLLNQDPDPAEPGKHVELRWKVEKFGNMPMDDIVFSIDAGYPFSIDAGQTIEKKLGSWSGYSRDDEYFTLHYKLRVADDAIEGTYTIKIRYKSAANPEWAVQEHSIRVTENKKPEFVLGTLISSPPKLTSDIDDAELKIELQNIGEGDSENVNIELDLPEGFAPTYGYSDRSNLGTISAGTSKTAIFYLDIAPDLKGGNHIANLTVNYKDDDLYKIKTLQLEIPLKDKPNFEIVSMSPEIISAGNTAELRLAIRNIGNKAESVSVRAYKESSQPFEFDEKTDYIGNLKSGETGDAILKLTVDEDAPAKDYILELEIRAIDGSDVIVQDKTVRFLVEKNQKKAAIAGIPLNSTIIMVIVVLAVAAGAFYLGKKSR